MLLLLPLGWLGFVRTNYFPASAKRLGPHESQARVLMAATDPATDGGGGGRYADRVSYPREAQHGNLFGPLSPAPTSQTQPCRPAPSSAHAALAASRGGCRGWGKSLALGNSNKHTRFPRWKG